MSPILTSTLRVTASLWLAGATVAIADPALASRPADARLHATVALADLNLQAPAGRAVAERRLRAAAMAVCDSGSVRGDQACIERVIAEGRQTLDGRAADRIAAR